MLYLVIYLIGWVVFGPLILAVMDSFDLGMYEPADYMIGAIFISFWPAWIVIALVLLPLRILFEYVLIPMSNKISKYFKQAQ